MHDYSSLPKISPPIQGYPIDVQPFIPIIPTDNPTLFFAHLTNRSYNWVNYGECLTRA